MKKRRLIRLLVGFLLLIALAAGFIFMPTGSHLPEPKFLVGVNAHRIKKGALGMSPQGLEMRYVEQDYLLLRPFDAVFDEAQAELRREDGWLYAPEKNSVANTVIHEFVRSPGGDRKDTQFISVMPHKERGKTIVSIHARYPESTSEGIRRRLGF